MSEAARTRRDDPRYEPRLDVPAREPSPAAADPLAELARLVGQDDPFRGMFRPGGAQARAPRQDHDLSSPGAPSPLHGFGRDAGQGFPGHDDRDAYREEFHDEPHPDQVQDWHDEHGRYDDRYGERGHADAHPDDQTHPEAYDDPYSGAHGEQHYERYAAEGDAYHDEAGLADGHLAAEAASDAVAATLPDMWARQDEAEELAPPVESGLRGDAGRLAPPASSARRPLAVLAAVLVLTGGGLAASFLVKAPSVPGSSVAGSNRTAPTIMAAAGPTKVKVDDPGTTAPEDQDAALLNKNGNVSSGPVRIVSSQEQPADLGQLPKSSDLSGAGLADGARPLPPAAPSPFPEPKRVKTFVVHPDGTMVSADGVPAAKGAAGPDAAGAPAAATPRTANRGATTPAAAPADAIAALAASPADGAKGPVGAVPPRPARQPAAPGARTASAKPSDAADAPAASGGFGVQLASSPVEADANAAFAKLKRKYPAQLSALTASVHKAETGDKPIYRVRVGSMSQEEANALCSQLKGAGGSCFVVHN